MHELPSGILAAQAPSKTRSEQRRPGWPGGRLSQLLAEREREFDARFQTTFGAFAPGAPNGTPCWYSHVYCHHQGVFMTLHLVCNCEQGLCIHMFGDVC